MVFSRQKKYSAKDRIGVQTYPYFPSHPADPMILVCATWAHHVDCVISEVTSDAKLGVELDPVSVEKLYNQLGEWLRHRKEEYSETN